MKSATATRTSYVLLSLLLLAACKEQPPWAQLGSLFTGPEAPPAGKALVYIYWPAENLGTENRIWVRPDQQFSEEIRKGGYTSVVVAPGTTSFFASFFWHLNLGLGGSVSNEYGGERLSVQRGEVLYLKIEQGTRLGITRFDFREVGPAVGASEIRKCRRMEPLN